MAPNNRAAEVSPEYGPTRRHKSSSLESTEPEQQQKATEPTPLKTAATKSGADAPEYETFAPAAMRWYFALLDKLWNRLPTWAGPGVASALVFLMGATIRAEWLMFAVYYYKWSSAPYQSRLAENPVNTADLSWPEFMNTRFAGFTQIWLAASIVGYAIYFGVGGFLHWYYYRLRRDSAQEWKCQPEKWLPPDLELHEIKVGSISLFLGNTLSAALVAWIMNDGYTSVYYNVADYGWLWWFLSWPVVFIWQDYPTYLTHRLYHTPFLYKHFHKLHHTYKQPTAFSVTAIHPIEFLNVQMIIASPIFLFPVHWVVITTLLLYTYYHGIVDHSGINFKAYWWQPWQPDCLFHDNHHQYFHVNFAFNIYIWDKLHGTYRQKDRVYREDIYYGFGKALGECSASELQEEMEERQSENATAYQTETDKEEMLREVAERIH